MGALTEAGLDALVAAGCPACHGKRLVFRSYVDGRLPLLAGEPAGAIAWVYDGEKFVDGVFEVRCADCKHLALSAAECPRCHSIGGLAKALTAENRFPVPAACPRCDGEEVRYVALLPAKVTYEGKRADKARTTTELLDPGFHAYRVECRRCGVVAERADRCPLCDAPGPLRARPG